MELGSVTERLLLSSDGQMVVVFRPQLLQFGHRDHHQVVPPVLPRHGPTIGGHCRVVAHSLTGEVVARIMLEIQDTFFFFSVFTGARFRSYRSLCEYKTNRENSRKRTESKKKKKKRNWTNRGNENRKVSKGMGGKRQAYTFCLSVCPWINLVKNVRIEFLLWLRRIN